VLTPDYDSYVCALRLQTMMLQPTSFGIWTRAPPVSAIVTTTASHRAARQLLKPGDYTSLRRLFAKIRVDE